MKARIKETGEIVKVENLYDDGTAEISIGGSVLCMKVSKFDFFDNDSNEIDWEQRRYEIAKEAITAIMSNSDFYEQVLYENVEKNQRKIPKSISSAAVIFADALIEQLKNHREV